MFILSTLSTLRLTAQVVDDDEGDDEDDDDDGAVVAAPACWVGIVSTFVPAVNDAVAIAATAVDVIGITVANSVAVAPTTTTEFAVFIAVAAEWKQLCPNCFTTKLMILIATLVSTSIALSLSDWWPGTRKK